MSNRDEDRGKQHFSFGAIPIKVELAKKDDPFNKQLKEKLDELYALIGNLENSASASDQSIINIYNQLVNINTTLNNVVNIINNIYNYYGSMVEIEGSDYIDVDSDVDANGVTTYTISLDVDALLLLCD